MDPLHYTLQREAEPATFLSPESSLLSLKPKVGKEGVGNHEPDDREQTQIDTNREQSEKLVSGKWAGTKADFTEK